MASVAVSDEVVMRCLGTWVVISAVKSLSIHQSFTLEARIGRNYLDTV